VLESTSSVIRNAEGEPEKLVVVNRNITERTRAEAIETPKGAVGKLLKRQRIRNRIAILGVLH